MVIGNYVKHTHCPGCESKDNLAVYDDGSCHCFGCGYTRLSVEERKRRGIAITEQEEDYLEAAPNTKQPMTKDDWSTICARTGTDPKGWRGLREDICKFFANRFEYDPSTGDPVKHYSPTTMAGKFVGCKTRKFPKDFTSPIGVVGGDCDLIGQWKFPTPKGIVLIVGGEVKQLAAYQMLLDAQKDKKYDSIAVVAPTTGEPAAHKQCAKQFAWFSQFSKIVICMDNDEAGWKANEEIAKAMPKGKTYIMGMRYNDPDEYLTKGCAKEFVNDFWSAKPYVPAGVVTAADAFDNISEELNRPRLSLPAFMSNVQKMMGGGILQGRIVNIIGDTSVGKTTIVRRLVYHFIFNSPVVPTIVSLEETAPQYMLELLALHLKQNLRWNYSDDELSDLIQSDLGQKMKQELCFKEDGSPRFYLIDERGASPKEVEGKMEEMRAVYGSNLFIMDVLTDMLRGSLESYAEDHLTFQKGFIKSGATIINVLHTRKPQQDKEGKLRKVTEYDALGTGSFVQSAAYNLLINRDKLADNELEKNTTEVDLPKCRQGKTGPAGHWYYDFDTVTMYDREAWLESKASEDKEQVQQNSTKQAPF